MSLVNFLEMLETFFTLNQKTFFATNYKNDYSKKQVSFFLKQNKDKRIKSLPQTLSF